MNCKHNFQQFEGVPHTQEIKTSQVACFVRYVPARVRKHLDLLHAASALQAVCARSSC